MQILIEVIQGKKANERSRYTFFQREHKLAFLVRTRVVEECCTNCGFWIRKKKSFNWKKNNKRTIKKSIAYNAQSQVNDNNIAIRFSKTTNKLAKKCKAANWRNLKNSKRRSWKHLPLLGRTWHRRAFVPIQNSLTKKKINKKLFISSF